MNKEQYKINMLEVNCGIVTGDDFKPDNIDLIYEMDYIGNSLENRMFTFKKEGNTIFLRGLFYNVGLLNNIFGNEVRGFHVKLLSGLYRSFPVHCSNLDMLLLSKYGKRKVSTIFDNCINYQSFDRFVSFDRVYYSLVPVNITEIVLSKYQSKWEGLYNTILKEYDILKPFDVSLSESESDKLKTLQDTSNRVINESLKTDYQTLKDESETKTNDKVYAYNSGGGVNSDSGDSSTTNQFSSTNNDTKTGSTTDTRNYERDITKSRDYSRKGNIGNKSYAQLIVEERQKLMFDLQEVILKDIASVLCRGKYI